MYIFNYPESFVAHRSRIFSRLRSAVRRLLLRILRRFLTFRNLAQDPSTFRVLPLTISRFIQDFGLSATNEDDAHGTRRNSIPFDVNSLETSR